jgi:AbrB family looped-hinge helix DNA binding protein
MVHKFSHPTLAKRRNPLMPLLKLRRFFQLTLPAEIRKQLNLVEGDYLEAEVVDEGILLKPVSVVERQKAGKALVKLLAKVRAQQRPSKRSPQEQEEEIADSIKDLRKRHA